MSSSSSPHPTPMFRLLSLWMLCTSLILAEEEPPSIGNFSLPASQQPSPLFGFSSNIVDKDEVLVSCFADDFSGRNKTTIDIVPNILYGITDDWAVNFYFPFTPLLKDGCYRSSGLEDFFFQTEYAYYNSSTCSYADQATLLASITFPTGSIRKNPSTGIGAPSLFLAPTFSRTWVDWFVFIAPAVVLTTSRHHTKYGNQFLYQFTLGKSFISPPGWILAWMLELDGQYYGKNRFHGIKDSNSGGSTIWITPSLWASTKEFQMQFGVTFPVQQNLYGHQRKINYVLNFNIGWSVY